MMYFQGGMDIVQGLTANLAPYMVKFLVSQLALIPIGFLFRRILPPLTTNASTRHFVCGILGLSVIFFIFGWALWNMVLQAAGVYLILYFLPNNLKYKLALVYAMGYMVWMHYCRLMQTKNILSFFISFPMMPATQKLFIVILGLHDGQKSKEEANNLSDMSKRNVLREIPSPVEYFGYVFYFAGVVVGPAFFYRDYLEFITGENMKRTSNCRELSYEPPCSHSSTLNGFKSGDKNGNSLKNGQIKSGCNGISHIQLREEQGYYSTVSPKVVVMKKLLTAMCCFHVFNIAKNYPLTRFIEDDFVASHGVVSRILCTVTTITFYEFRYFFFWILGEAVQNASGFGLYFVNDKPKWDLTCNIRISKVHFTPNMQTYIENWNIFTVKWLRYICYERDMKYKIWVLYAVNSLWHGLEFGLYVSFFSLILFTAASRKVRHSIRPYFLGTKWHPAYNILTRIATQITMPYILSGFIMRDLWATLYLYTVTLCWALHIAAIIILLLPLPNHSKSTKRKKTH